MEKDKPKRRGRVENLKPFKKGESGNPLGRASVPEDIKEARKFTAQTVERSIHKMLRMTKVELKIMLTDPKTDNLDLLLGSILAKGMSGDAQRANFILDRAGAQLPEPTPQININMQIQNMPNTELLKLAQEAITVIELSANPIANVESKDDAK